MMKKLFCFALAAAAALMLSACGGGFAETPAPTPEPAQPAAPVQEAPAGESPAPAQAATPAGETVALPEKSLADKKITVYSWGEYVPEKLFNWQLFRFIDHYGGEIEMVTASGDYYENLYKLVAAGEIPDIVVGEAKSFPTMIMRDLVQPWDEYLDLDDPIWRQTGAADDIEALRWNGSAYVVTTKAHTLGVMFYNKSIIDECGLEDPAALQNRGEWTWETFHAYLDETTFDRDGDGINDVSGIVNTGDFPIALFASTGETHIEYSGEGFINNLKSQKVLDAANFLYGIGNNGTQFMRLGDPINDFLTGKAAFVYTNDYRGYVDYARLWQTDGIGVVPMPAYKDAGQQYQAALPDFMWLMKGAKNPAGAALMLLAQEYDRVLNKDPVAASARETAVNIWIERGFTPDVAEAVVSIGEMPTKTLFSRCVDIADGSLEYRAMDQPWTTLADSASGGVDKALQDAVTPIR